MTQHATVFAGPEEVSVYVAITLKSGLRMYRDTGMKPNRMWSPKNMMRKAEEITGIKFKPRDYTGAIDALQAVLDKHLASRGAVQ